MEFKSIDNKSAVLFCKIAAACAFFSGCLTLATISLGKFSFSFFNLIDVGIFIGLGIGIWRKSRICASIMFIYHIINRFDMWSRTHDLLLSFNLFSVLWIIAFLLGVIGTFSYHKNVKNENAIVSK